MKYIYNTAKTRMYMYIDKSTIYFSNRKQFCGKKRLCCLSNPRIWVRQRKISPKLPDLFIQEYAINTCKGHVNLSVMHTCL